MILEVVKYGHPVLRQRGVTIPAITQEIQQLIADMLETMTANHGVGLAAQQIGRALQLAVIDVREVTDRPSSLEIDGLRRPVASIMPLVLVNPEVTPVSNPVDGPEGCLSFPEVYAEIRRPEFVEVKALDAAGQPLRFSCGGLLSRAIQHEVDHLNGILFVDRMDRQMRDELKEELNKILADTKAGLNSK